MTILLLLYALTFTLFAPPVFAQTLRLADARSGPSASPPSASPSIPNTAYSIPSSVSPTSPLYTDLLVNNMFHTFSCLAVGQSVIGQPCLTYQITQNAQGAIQSVPVLSSVNLSGGTLGAVTSLIGGLYMNPPVRTADYLASVGQGLGIVKEAHAQVGGSGAQVLSPILSLWQVSRNVSYVVMIIIFLVIGLMIMFRNKINPQTVITAQAALPGLVIGLILITFSYFLAGLISDMAFVGTNVVGYYFSAVRGKPGDQNLVQDISNKNVLSIFAPFTKIVGQGDVAGALGSIWNDLEDKAGRAADPSSLGGLNPLYQDPQKVLSELATLIALQFMMPFASMGGGITQIILGGATALTVSLFPVQMVGIALSFIAMVILIYSMFRLLLRLINNFITIIFLTITAPFQFLAAALPGRQGLTTNWILNMLANILAFPAVLAVFYFVAFLLGPDNNINKNCTPPCAFKVSYSNQITGRDHFPLLGGFNIDFINMLLAFGALIALPSVPDIINRTIGRLGVAGQLIGQEIGAGVGAGRGYAGQFQGGVSGLAGQAGRISNVIGYQPLEIPNDPIDPSAGVHTEWRLNPMTSQAGIKTKAGLWWNRNILRRP